MAPYRTMLAVITVKYGVTITVVRCILASTVCTVQTVIMPYRTTRQTLIQHILHRQPSLFLCKLVDIIY